MILIFPYKQLTERKSYKLLTEQKILQVPKRIRIQLPFLSRIRLPLL